MGRYMAFELLSEQAPDFANQAVPQLIDDPSPPLRALAVQSYLEQAKTATNTEAIGLLGFALGKARDVNQVQAIAKALEEFDIQVDLKKQLGFLGQWHIVGPFDHRNESAFHEARGPEFSLPTIDLQATYADGISTSDHDVPVEVAWVPIETSHPTAVVDLNERVGKVKGAIVYAFAEFRAEEAQDAEIRIGTYNGHKVWVNGELVIVNEVYHSAFMPDLYSGKCRLNKGRNQILMKVCQNEQSQAWAQNWNFMLRVCDPTGKAIPEFQPPAQQ